MSEGERLFLIVEPDASTHRALESALTERGDRVLVRESADQALEVLCSEPVDLVIASTTLADGDGFRLCSLLRDQADFDAIPLLFLSDDSSKSRRLEGLQSGAADYVTEPFFFEELAQRIDALLDQQEWVGSGESWEVSEGSLEKRSLIEILSEVEERELTGTLSVERDGRQAVVHFTGGDIVGAVSGTLEGKEALLGLVAWPSGEYVLRIVDRDIENDREPDEVVLVSIEPLEPWDEVVQGLPQMQRHYARADDELPEVVGFDAEAVEAIWQLFDGDRTIGEVISEGPSDLVVTLRIVDQLLSEDHLEDVTDRDEVPGPGSGEPKPDFARWLDPVGWSAAAVEDRESKGFRIISADSADDDTEDEAAPDREEASDAAEEASESGGTDEEEAWADVEAAIQDEQTAAEEGDSDDSETAGDGEADEAETAEGEETEEIESAGDGETDEAETDEAEAVDSEETEEIESAGDGETDEAETAEGEETEEVESAGDGETDEAETVEGEETEEVESAGDGETEQEDVEASDSGEADEVDAEETENEAREASDDESEESAAAEESVGEDEASGGFEDLPDTLDKPAEEAVEDEIPGEVADYDPDEPGIQPFRRHDPGTMEHVHMTLEEGAGGVSGTSVDETDEEPPSERIDPIVTPDDQENAPADEQMAGNQEGLSGQPGAPGGAGGPRGDADRATPDDAEDEDDDGDDDIAGGASEPGESSPHGDATSETAGIGPMVAVVLVIGGALAAVVLLRDTGGEEPSEQEPETSTQATVDDEEEPTREPDPEPEKGEQAKAEPTPAPNESADDSPNLQVVRDTRRTGRKVAGVVASKASESVAETTSTTTESGANKGGETNQPADDGPDEPAATAETEKTADDTAETSTAQESETAEQAEAEPGSEQKPEPTNDEPTGRDAPRGQGASQPTEKAESSSADEEANEQDEEANEQTDQATAEAEDSESDESAGAETFSTISSMIKSGDFASAEQELDTLPDRLQKDEKVRDLYLNLAAGYQTEASDVAAAKRVYREYLDLFPNGKYASQVRSILARLDEK